MASLKGDLTDVQTLLKEQPVDPSNILATMHAREQQLETLQSILPKLGLFDTKRIQRKSGSLSNDQLFRSLHNAIGTHNNDLLNYKESASSAADTEKKEKARADELTRIALKQKQLDCVVRHLDTIQSYNQDRGLQKAMLGQLYGWYEKGNSNVVPIKVETSPDILPPLPVPKEHRYTTPRKVSKPLASQVNLLHSAAASAKKLQLAETRHRNVSQTPLQRGQQTRNKPPMGVGLRGRNQSYGGAGALTQDSSHDTGVQLSLPMKTGPQSRREHMNISKISQSAASSTDIESQFKVSNSKKFQQQTIGDSTASVSSGKQMAMKYRSLTRKGTQVARPTILRNDKEDDDESLNEQRAPNLVIQPMSMAANTVAEKRAEPISIENQASLTGQKQQFQDYGPEAKELEASKVGRSNDNIFDAGLHAAVAQPLDNEQGADDNATEADDNGPGVKFPPLIKNTSVPAMSMTQQKEQNKNKGSLQMFGKKGARDSHNDIMSANQPLTGVQASRDTGLKYLTEPEQVVNEKRRAHQLSARVIDLTHDTLPENNAWRPIAKTFDKVPPQNILEDKILLRDWEGDIQNEFYKFNYDRRGIDQDVFRKLQAQGEIIKMAIDTQDLTDDKGFWADEDAIQAKAVEHIRALKVLKPYDYHKIQPQTYDLKMVGDPNSKKAKSQGDAKTDKKKKTLEKKNKERAAAKLGNDNALSDVEEEDHKSSSSEEPVDPTDDKYDPLAKTKEGSVAIKKASMLQTAVEHAALEMGNSMPVMSRGPEIELSTIKDVEDLKHTLAQSQINLPNEVLRRAIILPKDMDTTAFSYATPYDTLPRNPFTDPAMLQRQMVLDGVMQGLSLAQLRKKQEAQQKLEDEQKKKDKPKKKGKQ